MKLQQQARLAQTQKLVLTQKIRQALEILQLPSQELENLISQELQENPLLEQEREETQETEAEAEESDWDEEPSRSDSEESDPLDILRKIEEHTGEGPSATWSEDDEPWTPEPVAEKTLYEHLLEQVYDLNLRRDLEEAVIYVVYSLDHHGLLSLPEYELEAGWEGDRELLRRALEVVREMDPVGVGSGTVSEALDLQLERLGYDEGSVERRMVSDYFYEMAEHRIRAIAEALGETPQRVQEALDAVSRLNPWPGGIFHSGSNAAVIPDIIITRVGDRFVATLNDNRFPTLSISARNRRILESPSSSDDAREYVKKKFQRASWFIRSIMQRQETVTRIGDFLADYQAGFFENGIEDLRPLTLQNVADALGYNQSTISRAINGKYVQSPKGIHEMRFFFSRGVPAESGTVSSRTVKEELRMLIEDEDKKAPLSDAKLAELLAEAGMEVKRRTVANYRADLGIPSARKRRRY